MKNIKKEYPMMANWLKSYRLESGTYYIKNILTDEEFEGEIWAMAVPKELLDLVDEIGAWLVKYPITGYISEKFGNYSYSQRTNFRSNAAISWQDVFSVRLNRWRKV